MKFLVLLFFMLIPAFAAGELQDLFERVNNEPIKLQYTLEIYWDIREITDRQEGKLLLNEPEKSFRFEFGDNLWVCDGVTVWQHNSSAGQLVIVDLLDFDHTLHPYAFLNRFSEYSFEEGDISRGVVTYRWKKTPGDEDEFLSIEIEYDRRSSVLRSIKTVDVENNRSTYNIRNMSFLDSVSSDKFTFVPTGDLVVIDNR